MTIAALFARSSSVRLFTLTGTLVAGLVALVACSDAPGGGVGGEPDAAVDSGTSGASGSSGSSGSSGIDAGGDAKGDAGGDACNALVQQGPLVPLQNAVAPAPAAAGGVIANGVYVLTALRSHSGGGVDGADLGLSGRATLEVSGGVWQVVETIGTVRRLTMNAAIAGTSITNTVTCSSRSADVAQETPGSFTATPTSLTVFNALGTDTAESVYTKL